MTTLQLCEDCIISQQWRGKQDYNFMSRHAKLRQRLDRLEWKQRIVASVTVSTCHNYTITRPGKKALRELITTPKPSVQALDGHV